MKSEPIKDYEENRKSLRTQQGYKAQRIYYHQGHKQLEPVKSQKATSRRPMETVDADQLEADPKQMYKPKTG